MQLLQWTLVFATVIATTGCAALSRMAVNLVGNSLSGTGSAFASDEDPDLVREAIPFGLKTYESLLAVSPDHRGLLLSAASGFASYAFLLTQEADFIDAHDFDEARHLRLRASRLFVRGRDYALRSLALDHPELIAQLTAGHPDALRAMRKRDVPLLYWAGASWAGALSANKGDPLLLAELPIAASLVARVIELDETFDAGAAHEFFVSYEGGRPGGDIDKARFHYLRADDLGHGNRASLYLALAESVSVREQNVGEFNALIAAARRVDPDQVPELRVVNTLALQRAEWLARRAPELFVELEES